MVGLKNQGATCYMNSLLQTLFHLGAFRQAVYLMPTESDKGDIPSIPLALQRVFYRLQFGNRSVCTKELTKSFGWDVSDGFIQHDIQELNRVLCDNLEEKMKGTCSEGKIAHLFKGNIVSQISCTDIDFTSRQPEEFYGLYINVVKNIHFLINFFIFSQDISLNVHNCDDIYQSFDQYVAPEILDGDNKYRAEDKGLQTARKTTEFLSFPPVLFIQLKRFEYDKNKKTMVKVNNYFSKN